MRRRPRLLCFPWNIASCTALCELHSTVAAVPGVCFRVTPPGDLPWLILSIVALWRNAYNASRLLIISFTTIVDSLGRALWDIYIGTGLETQGSCLWPSLWWIAAEHCICAHNDQTGIHVTCVCVRLYLCSCLCSGLSVQLSESQLSAALHVECPLRGFLCRSVTRTSHFLSRFRSVWSTSIARSLVSCSQFSGSPSVDPDPWTSRTRLHLFVMHVIVLVSLRVILSSTAVFLLHARMRHSVCNFSVHPSLSLPLSAWSQCSLARSRSRRLRDCASVTECQRSQATLGYKIESIWYIHPLNSGSARSAYTRSSSHSVRSLLRWSLVLMVECSCSSTLRSLTKSLMKHDEPIGFVSFLSKDNHSKQSMRDLLNLVLLIAWNRPWFSSSCFWFFFLFSSTRVSGLFRFSLRFTSLLSLAHGHTLPLQQNVSRHLIQSFSHSLTQVLPALRLVLPNPDSSPARGQVLSPPSWHRRVQCHVYKGFLDTDSIQLTAISSRHSSFVPQSLALPGRTMWAAVQATSGFGSVLSSLLPFSRSSQLACEVSASFFSVCEITLLLSPFRSCFFFLLQIMLLYLLSQTPSLAPHACSLFPTLMASFSRICWYRPLSCSDFCSMNRLFLFVYQRRLSSLRPSWGNFSSLFCTLDVVCINLLLTVSVDFSFIFLTTLHLSFPDSPLNVVIPYSHKPPASFGLSLFLQLPAKLLPENTSYFAEVVPVVHASVWISIVHAQLVPLVIARIQLLQPTLHFQQPSFIWFINSGTTTCVSIEGTCLFLCSYASFGVFHFLFIKPRTGLFSYSSLSNTIFLGTAQTKCKQMKHVIQQCKEETSWGTISWFLFFWTCVRRPENLETV